MGDRVTSSSGKSRYNPCYTRCSPLWECGGALHKDSRTYRRHRDRFGQKTGASGDGAIGKGRKSRKAQRRASGRGRGGKNFGVGEAISPVSLEARKAGGAPANSGPVSREFVQCSREDGEGEGEEGASDYATIGSGSAKWEGRREELELRGGEGVEIDQWETEGELDTIVERSALDNEVCQPRVEDGAERESLETLASGAVPSEAESVSSEEVSDENIAETVLQVADIRNIYGGEEDMFDLLHWQLRFNVSNRAIKNLLEVVMPQLDASILLRSFERERGREQSLFRMKSSLSKVTKYEPSKIECCINGCMAYFGDLASELSCKFCKEPRYTRGNRIRKEFKYFPLIPRITSQQSSPIFWDLMQYRHKNAYAWDSPDRAGIESFRDYFDGYLYSTLDRIHNLKEDDIVFSFSTDGKQLFKSRSESVWPLLLLNLNLAPSERYKIHNMIPLGVIPGPKEPKCIESFLQPMMEEFHRLKDGLWFENPSGRKRFIRGFLLLITGDLPAINKLCRLKGHNGTAPCRFCRIHGFKHADGLHYPSSLCMNEDGSEAKEEVVWNGIVLWPYSPCSLPLRTHHATLEDIRWMNETSTEEEYRQASKLIGVKGKCCFASLPGIRLFCSFPIDIMHLLYVNVAKNMWNLWIGADSRATSDEPFVLSRSTIFALGKDMEAAAAKLPESFGRPPRNIEKYAGSFKAEEWKTWVLHYSIPLLKDRLREPFFTGWRDFVRCCLLCEQKRLARELVSELQRSAVSFFNHYEKWYFRYEPERASLMKYVYHLLLHLADSTNAAGPLGSVSQFTMERFIGSMTPMIRSTEKAVENISRSLLALEQLKIFRLSIGKLGGRKSQMKHHGAVSSNRRYQVDHNEFPQYRRYAFLSPQKKGKLSPRETYLLRKAYEKMELEVDGNENSQYDILDEESTFTEWGRLEILSPEEPLEKATIVASSALGDKRSQRSRYYVSASFDHGGRELSKFYGCVHKFIQHTWRGVSSMLALISWAPAPRFRGNGTCSFQSGAKKAFEEGQLTIESVEVIDGLIGVVERELKQECGRKRRETYVLESNLEELTRFHGMI